MENLIVKELSLDDKDAFEYYVQEYEYYGYAFLSDNSLKKSDHKKKKYMSFRNFLEWYRQLDDKSKIYLVLSEKRGLIGSFEIYKSINGYANVALDIAPTQRGRGYDTEIIDFIKNTCTSENIKKINILTSVEKLPLPYILRDSEGKFLYTLDMEIKNNKEDKPLIKKN
jgi:predicted acetyltransferase